LATVDREQSEPGRDQQPTITLAGGGPLSEDTCLVTEAGDRRRVSIWPSAWYSALVITSTVRSPVAPVALEKG